MIVDTDTEYLPDVGEFPDTKTGSPVPRSRRRSKACTASPGTKTAAAITSEVMREVLEVRSALELATDGAQSLLVSTLRAEDGWDELTAAVICTPGSGGFLTTLMDLRAKVTSEEPAAAFAAAVEILTVDRAERNGLWLFAHERGLVEVNHMTVNTSEAATDLAEALKNPPSDARIFAASSLGTSPRSFGSALRDGSTPVREATTAPEATRAGRPVTVDIPGEEAAGDFRAVLVSVIAPVQVPRRKRPVRTPHRQFPRRGEVS